MLLATVFSTAAVQETNNLKRDMVALELYLKDQEEYITYCPQIPWAQPSIEIYKKQLTSQLPENCKK